MLKTFYRKYRSQDFEGLVGQKQVVQTLQNAIKNDRLSHAYIFSGPRGTGKTSTARILAKALNCKQGPSATPCLTCEPCTQIQKGLCPDVVEIDAASNTGVDHIRTLNEQVHFAPLTVLYKIYIIDEAHMLSSGAFNAMLKTLEEPPEKTIFILATTEPQKIPATIHSRCQRHHFRHLTMAEIKSQLTTICTQESLTPGDGALLSIAKAASGCMRDGISLLNQVYAFKGASFDVADVNLLLGCTNTEELQQLISAMVNQDLPKLMSQLQKFSVDGVSSSQLVTDLNDWLRSILLYQLKVSTDDLMVTEHQEWVQNLATTLPRPRLYEWLDELALLEGTLKQVPHPDLYLQVRLLKLASPPSQVMPSQLEPAIVESKSNTPAPSPTPKQPTAPSAESTQHAETQGPKPVSESGKWQAFLTQLKQEKHSLFTILNGARYDLKTPGYITIQLAQNFQFFKEKLYESNHQSLIESLLMTHFGSPLKLRFPDSEPEENVTPEAKPQQKMKSVSSSSDKQINEIIEIFEGTLV